MQNTKLTLEEMIEILIEDHDYILSDGDDLFDPEGMVVGNINSSKDIILEHIKDTDIF